MLVAEPSPSLGRCSGGALGAFWGSLGRVLVRPRRLLGRPGGLLGRLGGLLGASWAVLEASWGLLEDKTRGPRVLEASWARLGLIFGRFLDGFWDEFSILFLPYP